MPGAPMVVTATRIEQPATEVAAAVTVVDRETLQRARAGVTVAEGLAGVPGLFIHNRGNFAQDVRLSIRGFGARSTFGIRGVRVLLDGIPLTLPDGQTGVDAIDPAVLARAEVLRGPSSALYGPASGGVVSLTSERGAGRAPFAAAEVIHGAYGQRQQRLEAGGSRGPVDGFLAVSHLRLDGYREHAATERTLVTGNGAWLAPGGGELTVNAAVVDSPRAEDPGGLTAAQAERDPRQAGALNTRFRTGETVRQQRLGVTWAQPAGRRGEIEARAYGTWRDFSNRLPFSGVRLERVVRGAGLEYATAVGPQADAARVLLGAEVQHQDDDRTRLDNLDGTLGAVRSAQRERVLNQGVFVRLEAPLGDAVRLDAGVRRDRVAFTVDDRFQADGDDSGDTVYAETSPSAGILWSFSPAARAWLRVASGFATPTTAELTDPGGVGGFNDRLRAETSRSVEAGVRGVAGGSLDYELAAYRVEVDGLLVPFALPGAPDRFAFENAGEARYQGVEAALEWSPPGPLDARASYSLQDARFVRFTDRDGAGLDGNRVPGVPRWLGFAALTWAPGGGWLGAWETRWVGSRHADNANRSGADAYAVTDVRVAYTATLGGLTWEAFAGVDNLLDEDYAANVRVNAFGGRYFEPGAGRGGYLGLAVSGRF